MKTKKNLKVLAINVCLRPYKPEIMFPLGLAYVVSAIYRAGYDLEIVDLDKNKTPEQEIENILKHKDFDVAAFGCIVTGYKIAKKLSKIIRDVKKDAIIIAGNSVADSIPNILLEKTEVDVAVIGEGEATIVEVLDKLNQSKSVKSLRGVKGIWYKDGNKIISNPLREVVENIDSIPFIKWDLFDMGAYIKSARDLANEPLPMPKEKIRAFMVNTARGCPFRCSFCYQVFRQFGYRHRSVNSIISEIKKLQKRYRINYIFFNDDLSFPTKDYMEEFADRILTERLKFFWMGTCRANLFSSVKDLPLLKKIRKSGCIGFGYSLESANKDILKSMNKHIVIEDFSRQKKLLDKAGLITWTSLVFGYPQETKRTIKETMDLCYRLGIYPSCGYLLPQPGTPMYDYILKKGLVKDEEEYLLSMGDRQDLRINLTKIPSDEFQAEIKKHLKRISDKLGLGLKEETLLKTTIYKSKAGKLKIRKL